MGLIDHFRAQAVAILKAVRHQVGDVIAPHRPQAEHAQRGTGGAIGIEIPHHDDARSFTKGVVQQLRGRIDATQLLPGQHIFYAFLKIVCMFHATAGVQSTQQRRQIRG